jgi:nitrogen fixation protein NifB
MLLCVATNGFNILPYIAELANYNVSHVTITVNAVDPEIGSLIYAWARDGKCVRQGKEAAAQLLERQMLAIGLLKEKGITVKINTIIIPGVNDTHIPLIAKAVALAGADILNCIPLLPAADTDFADKPAPTPESISEIQKTARQYIPLMKHCTRCRADAVGLLGAPQNDEFIGCLRKNSLMSLDPSQDRPYVAVASREGVLINQHLGEADVLLIYKENGDKFELIEKRKTPAPGSGNDRWLALAKVLKDCRVILASGAGPSPSQALQKQGIKVLLMEALIDEGLKAVFLGGDIAKLQVPWKGCNSACSGTGNGCS